MYADEFYETLDWLHPPIPDTKPSVNERVASANRKIREMKQEGKTGGDD